LNKIVENTFTKITNFNTNEVFLELVDIGLVIIFEI